MTKNIISFKINIRKVKKRKNSWIKNREITRDFYLSKVMC